MRPILFSKTATSYNTNGIGRLNPTECLVGEERNGAYEAKLTIPRNDKYASQIEVGSQIGMKVSDGSVQTFIVYNINKSLEEEIEVNCAHISYNLSYIPVEQYSADSAILAIQGIKAHSIVSNPFTFDTDIVSSATFEPGVPASARMYLGGMEGSLLDKYHGEYKFDNLSVFYYANRGQDNGVTIRWGKNITELELESSGENMIDGLVPYWTDGSYVVMGDVLIANQGGTKITTEDVSGAITLNEGQTTPTKAQVNSAGQEALAKAVTGIENGLKISYYQHPEIADVQLCDYVTVIYEPYNINLKVKVVKTIWDVLTEKYKSVELGETQSFSGISKTISSIAYETNNTKIRLERTEDGLISEVTRATDAEGALGSQIVQTAEYIQSRVASTQKEWDTTGYNVQNYGYDAPSADTASEHSGEYYLNQANGYLYYSNGTTWLFIKGCDTIQASLHSEITQTDTQIRLDVSAEIDSDIDDYDQTVNGYLTLYVAKDDNNQVVSMIEAASDYIRFDANRMFTVNSPYFTVDHDGNIAATNAKFTSADLNEKVTFYAFNPQTGEYDDEKGYIGIVTYGLGYGFGMRNHSNTVGIVMPEGTSYDWLWMGANNKSINFTGDELQPWSSGVNLGSNYHKWNWVVCDNISCTNAPWSSSDKRMKNPKGTIDKVRDFYMALKPLQYTFKKGVDNEDPENMHYGLIAQDVLKTYEKCYNTDKQGIVKKLETIDEGTIKVLGENQKYVINYNELHAFHIAMIQDLQAEIESLKSEIKSLRKEIKK